jgi:hypothetical protein
MRYLAITVACLLLASCDLLGPTACSKDGRFGIFLIASDSVTGQLVTDPAGRATASDGAYVETQPMAISDFYFALNRPGTYSVTIEATAYETWLRDRIVVKRGRDGCSVETVRMEARLQPRS